MLVNTRLKMDGLELLKAVKDKSAAAVFFDPQYRSVLERQHYGNEGERQKGRCLLSQMDNALIMRFLKEDERVLRDSGHLFLWVDKFILVSGELQSLLQECSGLHLVDMITWDKTKMGMGYRTRRRCEYLVVLQKLPLRAKGIWLSHSIPDVWLEKVSTKEHPHTKPLGLQRTLIEAVTSKGDIVIDACAGSFSVLTACQQTSRTFLGCDLKAEKEIQPSFQLCRGSFF